MDRDLTPEELRVLGSLIEKKATTPDQYPLSINALAQASNQKSNRDPVMELADADVREAITGLTRRGLVRQSSLGGRVGRFEHRLGRGPGSPLNATPEQLALLCLLMLRGPQTPGELRTRAQRLATFSDIEAVVSTLDELANHSAGVLIERMEREPGRRESRYRHCLGADVHGAAPAVAERPAAVSPSQGPSSGDDLEARLAALEREVAALRARLDGDDGAV